MAAFFMTVAMPIWTRVDLNRISDLERQATELRQSLDPNSDLQKKSQEQEKKIEQQATKIATQDAELRILRGKALFEGQNPYPRGFRLVHLGESTKNVLLKYAERKPTNKENWIEVDSDNDILGSAVFYKRKKAKDEVVSSLLIHLSVLRRKQIDGKLSIDSFEDTTEGVAKELVETFGEPDRVSYQDGKIISRCWLNKNHVDITLALGLVLDEASSTSKSSTCSVFGTN